MSIDCLFKNAKDMWELAFLNASRGVQESMKALFKNARVCAADDPPRRIEGSVQLGAARADMV